MLENSERTSTQVASLRRLNIGCGRRFHADWVNVDLSPVSPQVMACDIVEGLPFEDNSFDVVYHSHLLEHLNPVDGQRLIENCFRVLKPGGVLRIVVPDLEQIARLYLEAHERAWEGDGEALRKYEWMKLELLDQMVRSSSGGQMGPFMMRLDPQYSEFVKSRFGSEYDLCRRHAESAAGRASRRLSLGTRLSRGIQDFRTRLCFRLVGLLLGRRQLQMFRESLFRNQGEIHLWMYDRLSLRQLCEKIGLRDFSVCSAFESQIEDFAQFELDVEGREVRKPDSLFVECRKPDSLAGQKRGEAWQEEQGFGDNEPLKSRAGAASRRGESAA